MKIRFIIFTIALASVIVCLSCSSGGSKGAEAEKVSDSAKTVADSVSQRSKPYTPTKAELKAMQEEEARDEAREEYYSTDGDQADNPDFDDDIPGDEHDEEFIDNEGDPELYNE